jgi:dienelactone hydrolase
MHALELDIPARRDAPHAVIQHDRIKQTHAGARYEIEVLTWDAFPGMTVPALVYRPVDDQPIARPCVIVALASQTGVATHGELYSAQRHAANLALRGFVVFVFASGLCFNGLNGERLANSYAFDTYGRLSGSGFTSRSIDIQMYLRAFDYMAARADVDPDRIAASGYSYGGRMAYYLAVFEPRVAALGIAAAAVITEGDDSDTVYSARRDAAMTSRVTDWFTNGEPERIHHSAGPYTDALGDTLLLAPRPFRLVLGNQDPGTSISMASTRIERLVDVYRALDSRAMPPDLALDDGSHHFDASRRRVIEDWLAAVLRAEPLLAQPHEDEHETPVLNRSLLERPPSAPEPLTTRAIFARRALGEIEAKRASRLIEGNTPEQTRRRIAKLLKLSPHVVFGLARPMLLAERAYGLGPRAFNARFWLLPLGDHIDAAALTLTPRRDLGGAAALYVLDGDRLLPERHLLRAQIDDGAAVMVVYLPGFGPLRSPQERLGDLAMRLSMRLDRTLLGLGVEAVRSGLDLLDSWYPGVTVTAESHGIDAGAVIAFATVLDDRIAEARMHEGVATFTRFLTSQVDAIPAPTLSIPGLAAQVDIPDLQRLAGNGRLTLESESDLHEHVIDLRPVAQ